MKSLLNMLKVLLPDSLEDFLSFRGSVGFWGSFASVGASGLGVWAMFSPAETGVTTGLWGVIGYAMGCFLCLLLIGCLGSRLLKLAPYGYSMLCFVKDRFGRGMVMFVALISFIYMMTCVIAELTGAGMALALLFDWNVAWSVYAIMALSASYTLLGGLKASIMTDKLQFALLVPVMLVLFICVFSYGGVYDALEADLSSRGASEVIASFVKPGGYEMGIVLVIAILVAEVFHQGYWQRVYAGRNASVVKKSFIWGGVLAAGFVLLAGLTGMLIDSYANIEAAPSVVLFAFIKNMPEWLSWLTGLGIVLLVTSSIDTLLNGMLTSMMHVHVSKSRKYISIVLLLVGVVSAYFGSMGFSVLYLFLLADFMCAFVVIPLFYAMFDKNISTRKSMFVMLASFCAGVFFMPGPGMQAWSRVEPSLLLAFLLPLLVSGVCCIVFYLQRRTMQMRAI